MCACAHAVRERDKKVYRQNFYFNKVFDEEFLDTFEDKKKSGKFKVVQ